MRLLYGVGYFDGDYTVTKTTRVNGKSKMIWICPYYDRWRHMLARCYSAKRLEKCSTYKGCKVCDEWLIFSNFKRWMEQQDWQDKELDKDLLIEGNKIYSPDTCIFVDRIVNTFILSCKKTRGNYLLGVIYDKERNLFRSECCNPFTKKKEHLGRYSTEIEAHLAWKKRKHELACQLANTDHCNDDRLYSVLTIKYKGDTVYETV